MTRTRQLLWRLIVLALICVISQQLYAAISYNVTGAGTTHGATGTSTALTMTVGSTTPVILTCVNILSLTAKQTAPSWSLGSGTPVLVKEVRGGVATSDYASVWKVPAPTAGSGTLTLNWDTSITWAASADSFQGADQSDPSPVGDAVTDVTVTASVALQAANLTANDGTFGCAANGSSNVTSVQGTGGATTRTDNGGSIGIGTGYALGSGTITVVMSEGVADSKARVAVRVKAATATSVNHGLTFGVFH